MLVDAHHAGGDIVKQNVERLRVEHGLRRYDFLELVFHGRDQLDDKAGIALNAHKVTIEVDIRADDVGDFVEELVGIVQKFVDVEILDCVFHFFKDFVFDFTGEIVNAAIVVVESLSVDIGAICDVLYGDVVDVFFKQKLCKGAINCFFRLDYTSVLFFFFRHNTPILRLCVKTRTSRNLRYFLWQIFVLQIFTSASLVDYNIHKWYKSIDKYRKVF